LKKFIYIFLMLFFALHTSAEAGILRRQKSSIGPEVMADDGVAETAAPDEPKRRGLRGKIKGAFGKFGKVFKDSAVGSVVGSVQKKVDDKRAKSQVAKAKCQNTKVSFLEGILAVDGVGGIADLIGEREQDCSAKEHRKTVQVFCDNFCAKDAKGGVREECAPLCSAYATEVQKNAKTKKQRRLAAALASVQQDQGQAVNRDVANAENILRTADLTKKDASAFKKGIKKAEKSGSSFAKFVYAYCTVSRKKVEVYEEMSKTQRTSIAPQALLEAHRSVFQAKGQLDQAVAFLAVMSESQELEPAVRTFCQSLSKEDYAKLESYESAFGDYDDVDYPDDSFEEDDDSFEEDDVTTPMLARQRTSLRKRRK